MKAGAEGRLKTPMRFTKAGNGVDKDREIAAEAWKGIADGLSRSERVEDRTLAGQVAGFLAHAFGVDPKQPEVRAEQRAMQTVREPSNRLDPRR